MPSINPRRRQQLSISRKCEKSHIARNIKQLSSTAGAHRLSAGERWWNAIPKSPGVYSIFKDGKVVYCGETGNLQGRMRDLTRTVNHTFRRRFGTKQYEHRSDFQPASAKQKFPPNIETLLDRAMSCLLVKVVSIRLGRREIEESAILLLKPKFNLRTARY